MEFELPATFNFSARNQHARAPRYASTYLALVTSLLWRLQEISRDSQRTRSETFCLLLSLLPLSIWCRPVQLTLYFLHTYIIMDRNLQSICLSLELNSIGYRIVLPLHYKHTSSVPHTVLHSDPPHSVQILLCNRLSISSPDSPT